MKKITNLLIVFVTTFTLVISVIEPVTYAGTITTQEILTAQQRSQLLDKTERFVLEENVGEALKDYGVEKQSIIQRLSNLTDNELIVLSKEIDQAPAGAGALEVVGCRFSSASIAGARRRHGRI